jgi:hypothetical protein
MRRSSVQSLPLQLVFPGSVKTEASLKRSIKLCHTMPCHAITVLRRLLNLISLIVLVKIILAAESKQWYMWGKVYQSRVNMKVKKNDLAGVFLVKKNLKESFTRQSFINCLLCGSKSLKNAFKINKDLI